MFFSQLLKCTNPQRFVYKSPAAVFPYIHSTMQVKCWYKENVDPFLERTELGSSLSESEELLQEHEEFELKAKVGLDLKGLL